MLVIDGSYGEGGGQVLRTALSLSMITGIPFRVENVRAKRPKPGLLRQHLTCLRAAQAITHAKVSGGDLGATAFSFEPGPIRSGDYTFAVGSAGSTALVFQTILPALLHGEAPSRVVFTGGTHNPNAPTFDYLSKAFLPLVQRIGASVNISLHKAGFYPAGGGMWAAEITPAKTFAALILDDAGPLTRRSIVADVANLPIEIAHREATAVASQMSWPQDTIQCRTVKADGQGNVLSLHIACDNVCEVFTAFGARDVSVQTVAADASAAARAFLAGGAPVGPHLADQLMVPMAVGAGGAFTTTAPTPHARPNAAIIEKFLPVDIVFSALDNVRWRIAVQR